MFCVHSRCPDRLMCEKGTCFQLQLALAGKFYDPTAAAREEKDRREGRHRTAMEKKQAREKLLFRPSKSSNFGGLGRAYFSLNTPEPPFPLTLRATGTGEGTGRMHIQACRVQKVCRTSPTDTKGTSIVALAREDPFKIPRTRYTGAVRRSLNRINIYMSNKCTYVYIRMHMKYTSACKYLCNTNTHTHTHMYRYTANPTWGDIFKCNFKAQSSNVSFATFQ